MRYLSAVFLVMMVCPTVPAAVLYNNGPSNLSDGANISDFYVADDFTLGSNGGANLQQISFFSSPDSDPFPSFSNSIFWAILTDANGMPGEVVSSGLATPTFTDTGSQILGTEEFQLTISVIPAVNLTSNTDYWLALAVDPGGNLDQSVYWDSTSETHGAVAMASTSVNGPWSQALSGDYGTDLAFVLSGTPVNVVPEISTLKASLAFSLLMVALSLRLRLKSTKRAGARP